MPALALGQWLERRGVASAAIDLSDGLSSDLHRLCRASGAGARIYAERLPRVAVPDGLRSLPLDELTLALHGGEDYGLLFTVPQRMAARIPKKLGGAALTRIGEMVRGRGAALVGVNGTVAPLEPRGWDHFRNGQ